MIDQPDFATYFAKVATGMDGLSGPLNGVSAQPETSVPSRRDSNWTTRTAPSNAARTR